MIQLAGEHPHRQRQVAAQPHDVGYRGILAGQAGPVREPDQQGDGLIGREGIQADRLGVFQRRQVSAAGDQHQAPGAPGKQRPHLVAAGRVIEHKQ